jgi:hypothetical protein
MGLTGAAGATGATGAAGSTGAVGVAWRGEWLPEMAYAMGDGVSLSGSSYVAFNATTTQPPSADWLLIAQAGATGAAGAQGPAGAAGPQGPAGATGAQGPQGAAGAQGPQGVAGAQGPQGVAGPAGPQGAAGATGAAGAVGPAGPGNTIAYVQSNSSVSPTIGTSCTNFTNVQVTVNVTAGHVVEIVGTAWVRLGHTSGTKDEGYLVVGMTPTDCSGVTNPNNGFFAAPFSVSAAATTDGATNVTVPFRQLFSATTTGSLTFYLNGIMTSGADPGDRFWFGNMAAHVY